MKLVLLVLIMLGYILGGLWLIGNMDHIVKTAIHKYYNIPIKE